MRLAAIALVATGCIPSWNQPGTLAGEAQGALESQTSAFTSTTVHNSDGSENKRDGVLQTLRYTGGIYMGTTRWGALSGVEFSLGMGWLTGEAEALEDDAMEKNHFYIDNEWGGVIQPFSLSVAKIVVRIVGDFGVGWTRDDRYPYAGARFGFGSGTRRWAFDASARRRFGDVPGNAAAYEDHLRAVITFRPGKQNERTISIGAEYVRGDQRTIVNGVEQGRNDYLFRGRYEMMSLVLSIGGASRPQDVRIEFPSG
ncbi:MAG: hypothetical protein AB7T06_12925 [Kofleriaceae bacterium]